MQQPLIISEREINLGMGALVFAMISTVIFTIFLCIWTFPFTLSAIVLGAMVIK